jgi:hypothetical protein
MGSGDPYEWLRNADDAMLDQFTDELTETLPPDDPMIAEMRHWLRRMRDTACDAGSEGHSTSY